MTFAAGMRIGRYALKHLLGEGGFGVVYVAADEQLGRDCAIKFLLPRHTSNRSLYERFLKEARIAAKIDHPAIVTVFDSGIVEGTGTEADGAAFIAMELLKGRSLAARIEAAGALHPPVAIEIARQIAGALAAAHAVGVVHRDLKPENIFLVPDRATVYGERVKVLDFGIAKLAEPIGDGGSTATSLVFGTPRYMSPEQCRSSTKVDHRTDIYALGVMLFEMLCGRRPFDGEVGELISMHQVSMPPAVRSLRPEVSVPVDSFVAALLAKNPDERVGTMTEVISRLDKLSPRAGSQPGAMEKTLPAGSGGHDTVLPEPASVDLHASSDQRFASTQDSTPPASSTDMPAAGPSTPPASSTEMPRPKHSVDQLGSTASPPPASARTSRAVWLLAVVPVAGVAAVIAWTQRSHDQPVATTQQPAVGSDVRPDASTAGTVSSLRAVPSEPRPPDGMVYIPRAELAMGSTDAAIDATFAWCKTLDAKQCSRTIYERERPQHRVTVSGFFLDRHERTNRELVAWLAHAPQLKIADGWASIDKTHIVEVGDERPIAVRDGVLVTDGANAALPATFVTYDGAAAFCADHAARLPTEAEWERAARGADGRAFSWGDDKPTCAHAVFGRTAGGACALSGTGPVAVDTDTRDRTPEGVMHLAGNVAEYVADRFGPYAPCEAPCTDPVTLARAKDNVVIRGGSAFGLAEQMRGAGRSQSPRTQPHGDTGFRCAASAPKGTP